VEAATQPVGRFAADRRAGPPVRSRGIAVTPEKILHFSTAQFSVNPVRCA